MTARRSIVFLVYPNRSGSTFLANQLSMRPEIAVPPEGHGALENLLCLTDQRRTLSERLHQVEYDLLHHRKLSTWGIDPDVARKHLAHVSDEVDAFYRLCDVFADVHKPDASVVIVKGRFLQQLIERFGYDGLQRGRTVRAIFLLRDPRAIFASQKTSLSTRHGRPMQENPVVAALRWRHAADQADKLACAPFGLPLRYEDLVMDNDETLARTIAFLGLEPQEHAQGASTISPSLSSLIPDDQRHLHRNIAKPPMTDRIHAWRDQLTPPEASIVTGLTGRKLGDWGYEKAAGSLARPTNLVHLFAWSVDALVNRGLRKSGSTASSKG